ncbi:MAG: hypothetical protein AABX74_00815 [Nanoarchaeota archaeon]
MDDSVRNFVKLFIYLLFGSLGIYGGFYFLDSANSIDPIPPFKTYEFNIRASPEEVIINQFLMEYDFNTNTGNISLRTTPFLGDAIDFYLPKELNVQGIHVYDKFGKLIQEDRGYNRYYEEGDFSSFLRIKHNSKFPTSTPPLPIFIEDMIINISGNAFYPNGNFRVNFENARPQSLSTFLRLHLGKYECGFNCFIDYNEKTGHFIQGDSLNIHLIEDKNDDTNIDFQWFIINTINKAKLDERQIRFNIAVSLLIAGLVLLVEFAIVLSIVILTNRMNSNETSSIQVIRVKYGNTKRKSKKSLKVKNKPKKRKKKLK